MLTFFKGHYTEHEIYVLRNVIQDAKLSLETSWAECDIYAEYGEKSCSECYLRDVCADLERLIKFLKAVEKPVEIVDNTKNLVGNTDC